MSFQPPGFSSMKSKSHFKRSSMAVLWSFSSAALLNLGFLNTIGARPGAILPDFEEPLLGVGHISSASTKKFTYNAPPDLMDLGKASDDLRKSARFSSPEVLEPERAIDVEWWPDMESENVKVVEGTIQPDKKRKPASLWRSSTQRAVQRVKLRLEAVGKVAKSLSPAKISKQFAKGRIHAAGWNPNMVVETADDAVHYVTGFNVVSFTEYIKNQWAWVTSKTQLHWLEILHHLTAEPEERFTITQWGTMMFTLERPFHDSEIRESTKIAADVDASDPQVPVSLSHQHSGSAPNEDTHAISNGNLEGPFHDSELRESTNIAADIDASKSRTPGSLSHPFPGSPSNDDTHAISEAELETLDTSSNTVALSEDKRRRLQLVLGSLHTFVLNRGDPLQLDLILSDAINDLYRVIWFRNQKHPGISTLTEQFHTYLDLRLPLEARRPLKVQPTPYDR